MRDHPDGAELLATAQKVLRDKLLLNLPANLKHEALMVANAMAIAARQLAAGEKHYKQELDGRLALLPNSALETSRDGAHQMRQLNRELGAEIRSGAADLGQADHDETYRHLRRVALQRVLESNPKYVSTAGLTQP